MGKTWKDQKRRDFSDGPKTKQDKYKKKKERRDSEVQKTLNYYLKKDKDEDQN